MNLTQYKKLKAKWDSACSAIDKSVAPTDRMYQAEQETYDALIDYVDESGLTYSEYDPRGQE